ncbi:PREDICTED: integral membrane protein GPR180-like [Priapulus caudatus]|uniref:Integral membrane protein GPR180-like n=1 Tax=Priapulus caudatus TaxID=37621 RepID=A0ABM1DXI1_PRICU|nr:PREDICTED: integral membrane protein GPR180-like [Priapulus caudatus]
MVFISRVLILFIVNVCISETVSKTIRFTTNSAQARKARGLHVASFTFHGNGGEVRYLVNGTGHVPARFFIYDAPRWKEAQSLSHVNCTAKIHLANFHHRVSASSRVQVMPPGGAPMTWHVVYADIYTCTMTVMLTPNYMEYTLLLMNPDVVGNATNHFSVEQRGLLTFYGILVLLTFILMCIYAPQVYEAVIRGTPMHAVFQALSICVLGTCLSAFFMATHLTRFASNGEGLPSIETFSLLCDMVSQAVMGYVMLYISLGWMLAGTWPHISQATLIPPFRAFTGLLIVQMLLFAWTQLLSGKYTGYLGYRSDAGLLQVILNLGMASVLVANVNNLLSRERSVLKKDFYRSFTKVCLMWFLSYPILWALSCLVSPHLWLRVILFGETIFKVTAVVLLFKLVESRSLYWEVSSLWLPTPPSKSWNFDESHS